MKTSASVTKKSPVVSFPNGKRIKAGLSSNERLTIRNNALGEWINRLNKATGVFYLHIDAASPSKGYSLHYKCHLTGKLLEMGFESNKIEAEVPKKAYIEALLLDLGIFQGNEPIVVFDKKRLKNILQEQFPIIYQHTDALDSILGRVHDLKEVFDSEVYYDTLFRETSVKEIHRVLYTRNSNAGMGISESLAMHQVFEAIQSIYFQVTGLKVVA